MPSSGVSRLITLFLLTLVICVAGVAPRPALGDAPWPSSDAQSRTGPTPPPEVLRRDLALPPDRAAAQQGEVILNVPAYSWRHGCGPTALGMVIGYYDGLGYADLITGPAATQTYQVNQAIASGGDSLDPFATGNERHYEDYARPQDASPLMRPDDYISAGRAPHGNDSIADWMYTSRSTHANYYGWSWASHMGPAWVAYVNQRNPNYAPAFTFSSMGSPQTWPILIGEIDAGRPMVFLVDTDANGGTDHFVTVIGYRASPRPQYASLDTWYPQVRWEDFRPMARGIPWGIWGGWSLSLAPLARYTLNITIRGAGEVTRTPDAPTYIQGEVVTIVALPASGWLFGGWGGDVSGRANPLDLAMTSDMSLVANFYHPATLHPRARLPIIR